MDMIRSSRGLLFAVVTLISAWGPPAAAASVVRIGTRELLDDSQLVFHGTVQSYQTRRSDLTGDIVTRVLFAVHETLKGRPAGDIVELDFLGGTLDGEALSISGLVLPALGEEGIYFVEQLDQPQVNPLFGWWQGEFVVRHDSAGRKVIHTQGLEPVYDFVLESPANTRTLSFGAAAGVVTAPSQASPRPLTLDDFKSRVRALAGVAR